MNRKYCFSSIKQLLLSPATLLLLWIFIAYVSFNVPYAKADGIPKSLFPVFVIGNPYIMIYGVFTILFFYMGKAAAFCSDETVIRFGSFFKFRLNRIFVCIGFSVCISFVLLAACLLIGAVFLPDVPFSSLPADNLTALYASSFGNSVCACAAAFFYWILGLAIFAFILNYLASVLSPRMFAFSCFVLYLLTVIGVTFPEQTALLSLFMPARYLILSYPLSFGDVRLHIGIAAVLCVLILAAMRLHPLSLRGFFRKHRFTTLRSIKWILTRWLFSRCGIGSFIVLTAVILLNNLYLTGNREVFGGDILLSGFVGYGSGYARLIPFIFMLICNSIPLYVLSAFFSDGMLGSNHLIIRMKTMRKWLFGIQISYITYLLLYIAFSIAVSVLFASVFRPDSMLYSGYIGSEVPAASEVSSALFLCAVLRLLELFFTECVFLFAYTLLQNATASFIISVFPYFILFYDCGRFFPYGASSLLRHELSLSAILTAAAIYLAVCAALSSYFALFGYRRFTGNIK